MPDLYGSSAFADVEPPDYEALLDLSASRPAWHADAACREAPPDVSWFPERGQDIARAKAVCQRCLVATECLAWSLDQGSELTGLWAGLTGRDRTRMRRRPAAAA